MYDPKTISLSKSAKRRLRKQRLEWNHRHTKDEHVEPKASPPTDSVPKDSSKNYLSEILCFPFLESKFPDKTKNELLQIACHVKKRLGGYNMRKSDSSLKVSLDEIPTEFLASDPLGISWCPPNKVIEILDSYHQFSAQNGRLRPVRFFNSDGNDSGTDYPLQKKKLSQNDRTVSSKKDEGVGHSNNAENSKCGTEDNTPTLKQIAKQPKKCDSIIQCTTPTPKSTSNQRQKPLLPTPVSSPKSPEDQTAKYDCQICEVDDLIFDSPDPSTNLGLSKSQKRRLQRKRQRIKNNCDTGDPNFLDASTVRKM